MALWHTTYPGVDPDFDEMGGELTLHQIADPVPMAHTEAYPGQYRRQHCGREWQKIRERWNRFYDLESRLNQAWNRIALNNRNHIQYLAHQLVDIRTKNYPRFVFHDNMRCNKCIPYNGSHTRDYWGTGQKDPW